MKIAVTGRRGLLSSELQSIDESIVALSKEEFDVYDESVIEKLSKLNPDIVIHSAAITSSKEITKNPVPAMRVNIIGTARIAEYCYTRNKRMVFISTDYVYPGTRGDYKESDAVLPNNDYAWTKLAGECSTRLVKNHLIIRTSFGPSKFPYDSAWINQSVSKDYVDVIAPMILKASTSNATGIINIGTESKSMYEYASKRNKVEKAELETTKDFTLNIDRYESLFLN